MSADNILIILEHKGKVRVFDVNFSGISSHESWSFPLTVAKYEALRDEIVKHDYNWEIWSSKSESQAEQACRNHQRNHIVEYGFQNIITRFDPEW